MINILVSNDHAAKMSSKLFRILRDDFDYPVRAEWCVSTIGHGYGLKPGAAPLPGFREGRPWSSDAAFAYLAGRGYVRDPRIAYKAIALFAERHVLWLREQELAAWQQRRHRRGAGSPFSSAGDGRPRRGPQERRIVQVGMLPKKRQMV